MKPCLSLLPICPEAKLIFVLTMEGLMNLKFNFVLSLLSLGLSQNSFAHIPTDAKMQPVLTELSMLNNLNFPVFYSDKELGLGMAWLTPAQQQKISDEMHARGKCAGFEVLDDQAVASARSFSEELQGIRDNNLKNSKYQYFTPARSGLEVNPMIQEAIMEVRAENLKEKVTWLSSFPNRFHKSEKPNAPVEAMKERLEALLSNAKMPFEVSLIDHKSTPMKSIRVRLPGSTRPDEIVVLGGHFDSIVSSVFGGGSSKVAPGADDNASGSANLFETLRIVSQKEQPQRSIEFFWYAGEEAGLLGSAEIARTYKDQKMNVVGVLQLDMTLNPGSGPLTIGSMTDFTSAWLRDYLVDINKAYKLGVNIINDKCGYGCSDHASWYKNGFSTLMPFESTMSGINKNIHTVRDVIDAKSNFDHSAAFARIAVVFALDLGNSTQASVF